VGEQGGFMESSWHQERDAAGYGAERLRLPPGGEGRAPAGAHFPLRRQRAPAHIFIKTYLVWDAKRRAGVHA